MSTMSKKWKSGTWRLGKPRETNASKQHLNIFVSKSSCKCGHVQSKEPEMVETPLPYNWSPVHDYEWGQNHQQQSSSIMSEYESSMQDEESLSESPEIRERLERLASGVARKPGHTRSDSAGSLHLSSHFSDLLQLEQACKQLKDERDRFQQLSLSDRTKLREREEEFVVKEREFATAVQKVSRAMELERNDCRAKVEQILGEKVVEAEKSAEHIRSLEARLQEGDPNREELHKRLTESSKDHALSIVVQNSEVQRLKTLENALLKEVTQLQQQLARSEARYAESNQVLETKNTEIHVTKERMYLLERQLQQGVQSVRLQIAGLQEEIQKLQNDQLALQLQLDLESNNHARIEEDWTTEREELEAVIAHLETELQLANCNNGELDFLITPVKKGYSDRDLGSPKTPRSLSIQTLLDMGEASLEVEGDGHDLHFKVSDTEARLCNAAHELQEREKELQAMREQNSVLKDELVAEKDKAKEEAEDLTQEMAELRYRLMETIEQERELRAQAEQASVLRVEELESQVKDARQEVVLALACRREAEMQSAQLVLEIQRLQLSLENLEQDLREAKETATQAKLALHTETEQVQEKLTWLTAATMEAKEQEREMSAAYNCLLSENLQLRTSLNEFLATTAELAETFEYKELQPQEWKDFESGRIHLDHLEIEEVNMQGEFRKGTEKDLECSKDEGRPTLEAMEMEVIGKTKNDRRILKPENVPEAHGEDTHKDTKDSDVPVQQALSNAGEEMVILPNDQSALECDVLYVHQAWNNPGASQKDFQDPLIERVRIQVETLDGLQITNEQLCVELEELQLQSALSNGPVTDEPTEASGLAIEIDTEEILAEAEVGASRVDNAYGGTTLYTQVEQLRTEIQSLRLQNSLLQLDLDAFGAANQTSAYNTSSLLGETGETPGTPGLQDKFVCITKQEQLWAVKEVAEAVESITQELTKHLRLILRAPLSTKQDLALELDTRIRSWSNVSSKGLQTKLAVSGAVEEWGELAVDLLGQSRRELGTAHQKLRDCEVDLGYLETLRQERVTASKEVRRLRDEIDRLEESHTSETIYKNQESFLVNKKLESAREHELLRRSELAWAESDICPKEADGTIDTFVESSERLLEDQETLLVCG